MDNNQTLRRSAALLMAGAAVIHFGLIHTHFAQWWAAGALFLLSAVLQMAWAAAAWSGTPSRLLLAAGQSLNVGLVAVWLMSRTSGMPFGPERWTPEAMGAADVVCVALELGCIAAVALLRVRQRTSPQWATAGVAPTAAGLSRSTRGGLVTAAVAVAVVAASGVALAAPGHDDAHPMADVTADASADAAMTAHDDMATANGAPATGTGAGAGGAVAGTASGNGERHDMTNLPDVSHATDAQKAAARKLLVDTEADTAAYEDLAKAKAAGFDVQAAWDHRQALMARRAAASGAKTHAKAKATRQVGLVHVANKANRTDGRIQDPTAPETLIYSRAANGTFTLVGVMYTAEKKAPPTTYQPYVRWHFHESCIDPTAGKGSKVKLLAHGATCPAGTTVHRSGYMTHMWFVDPTDLVHAYAMKAPLQQLKASAATTS